MTAAADVSAQRRTLWYSGFRPVPVFNFDARVNSPGKQPKGFAWQADAMRNPPLSVVRQPDVDALNTGIMANGLRAIDLDIEDADVCAELTALATDMFGQAPMRWRNNSGRRLLVYRAAQGEPGKRSVKGERGTVEVLGKGQQFVAYGRHPSGAELLWTGNLTDWVADDLPAIAEDDLTAFLAKASEILGSADHARAVVPLELGAYTAHSETGLNEIADLIRHVNPDAPYETWIQALMAVHAATGGSGAGLSIADEWSSRGSKYRRGEVEHKWRSFRSAGINGGTLAALAREHGADLAAIRIAHMPEDPKWAEQVKHGREVMRNMTVARRDTVSDAPFAVQRDGSIIDQKTGEIILDAEPVSVREEAQDEESSEWVNTTGLIGEITDWIVETARRPNRPLAVGAAIAIIGTMCGRHLATPTGCGTHLFIGCIGASTIGKDRPLKAISQILTAAGFPQLAATGKFKSDSAIETMLSKSPCCCAVVDEMGTNLLAKSSHARASTHEQGITGVLRELWSTSFDTWHGSARALENAKVIEAPAMSIYGASTIDEFYASLGKGVVQNGFLNRFTIIKAAPRAEPRDVDVDAMRTVPDSIVQGLLNLLPREEPGGARHGVPLNTGAHVFDPYRAPPVRTVKYASDEVGAAYTAFDNSILARMDRYPETQSFLGRTAEMTIRLATIHAVSKLGLHAEVRMEDLEWAKAVANASARAMIGDVADRIIESDFQGRFKRVEAIIRERVSLKRSELTKRLNGFMTMRELTDILKNMEESGLITQQELKTIGRPAVVIRLVE